MDLPAPVGTLSSAVVTALRADPLVDERALPGASDRHDAALSLWTLQELHYRGFDDVDDRHEWQPALVAARLRLEGDLERRLRDACPAPRDCDDVVAGIEDLIAADDGPSLARHVQVRATRDEVDHLLRQRSLYHLKEADPTAWVVPRLDATVKAALVEIQFDEYGAGDATRMHHRLFEDGLRASGIDAAYGAHLAEASTATLEQNCAMSMFGLQRRLRGAALGHFAAFEATSSLPSRQMAQGLDRLGYAEELVAYYDEHIEADAVHEHLALRDVCGALVAAEPSLAGDVLLGAWTCLAMETAVATDLLDSWASVAA